jgi:D-lactate dehydrogenase (cytochrome)
MVNRLIKAMSDEFAEYLKDESRTVGSAESISFPKEEDEIIKLMQTLYPKEIPITIQGARTGLAAGAVPGGGHIMNISRMDKATAMRKDDNGIFHVSVQPGMILSNLREYISGRKFNTESWTDESRKTFAEFCKSQELFFSPDPTEASATIGGMVACNASGARSYLYGPTRNHVTGLKLVLYNGETLTLRRGESFSKGRILKLVSDAGTVMELKLPSYQMPKTKNASGYHIEDNMDAIDLFIGSDGTLGVITEIEVKLLPLPQYIWSVSCFFDDMDDSIKFVETIRNRLNKIAAIEFFDGDAMKILMKQRSENPGFSRLPEVDENKQTAIYLELHYQEEKDAIEGLRTIGTSMDESGGSSTDTWVARNDSDRDRLVFFRHAVPESVNMLIDERKKTNPTITKLGTDMSVPDDKLGDIVKTYSTMLEESGLQSAIWGHIGDNHLHVNLLPNNDDDYAKGKILYGKWAQIVTEMGGAVSAEHGVGKIKSEFLTVMYGEKHIQEMAEFKQSLDPAALLGAGNMFKPIKGGAL